MKTKKKAGNKPGRKPLAQKRAVKRRQTTEAKVNDMLTRLGYNPFHMTSTDKKCTAATRSLTRAIRRFQQDYAKIVDKYGAVVPSEQITRQSVISALSLEMAKALNGN